MINDKNILKKVNEINFKNVVIGVATVGVIFNAGLGVKLLAEDF